MLMHDLRVVLAVKPVALDRPRRPCLVQQRAVDRAPTGAVGPQQGTVDVEKDEFHAGKIGGQLREVSGRRTATSMPRSRSAAGRSEERRVGKEGRSRWSPYH